MGRPRLAAEKLYFVVRQQGGAKEFPNLPIKKTQPKSFSAILLSTAKIKGANKTILAITAIHCND